ncbi:hypothetical protein GYMLUDRAFT_37478 [Collybiopsis luxurians FD-317 M1]|nr:hypothetical protein GYMLUDRAFT_37478 [Collybiopsis luxurians FD-317 M1]
MPKIYLKDAIFHSKTFCCCLPVRFGLISMSLLGILFGGLFSVLLWFEVSDTSAQMDPHERTAFILAGLVETLLFIASTLGFVGAIVRKQLFIQIYAYFIYVHFLVNLAVAGFFLYVISHFSSTAINKACLDTIKNSGAQSQCSTFLSDFRTVYIVVALLVLLIELYGALIVARYVHQIKTEKSTARSSRMILLDRAGRGRSSMMPGFDGTARYSKLSADQEDDVSLIPKNETMPAYPAGEFNPYENSEHPPIFPSHAHNSGPSSAYDKASEIEDGYGGGSWTHEQISQDEKAMLERASVVHDRVDGAAVSYGHEHARSDVNSAVGPLDDDPLPRYAPPELTSELR